MQDKLFCVGQKAVINKKGFVLVLHDPLPSPGGIDLPGGKIQEGEMDFVDALKREVHEETGLTIKVGRPFYTSYFEFDQNSGHRNAGKKIYLVFFECQYIKGKTKISEEHDWYKWVDKKNYHNVFKKKNNVYEALTIYFNELKS